MTVGVLDKALFKQMRKGTRSCHECRRRKVKCRYESESSSICHECSKHGRQCVKQGYIRDRALQARVVKVQSALDRLNHERVTTGQSDGFIGNGGVFMQLFDNKILLRDHTNKTKPPSVATSVVFQDAETSSRDKLLSTIAGEPYIMDALDLTSGWWTSWRDQHWALRKNRAAYSLRDYVQSQLAKDDTLPTAIGLICLAMSLTLLRPGLDDRALQLSADPKEIVNMILATVDQVCKSDLEDCQEPDLVLLLLLKGKLHAESNQVRKAWLHMKRATEMAQAQNLGVPVSTRSNNEDVQAAQQFLGGVLEADRFMSMVFGFPYTKDPRFSDVLALEVLDSDSKDTTLRMRALRRVLALAAQHINDRNIVEAAHKESMTDSVETVMNRAYRAMPLNWWEIYQYVAHEDASLTFETLLTQLWFWQVRSFLYLPNLLHLIDVFGSISDSRSFACLEAARNVIQIFTVLRGIPSLSVKVCNCDDFQGVLAGTILLLGAMQDVSAGRDMLDANESSNTVQLEQDMALVENLRDVFRYRAHEQGGLIAKQGLSVLDMLVSFFEEDETREQISNMGSQRKPTAIMLPYFGVIYVRLTKLAKEQSTKRTQQATPDTTSSQSGSSVMGTASDSDMFGSADARTVDTLPILDSDQVDQLGWTGWNQFVFDAELSQDWNLGSLE